MAIIHSTTIRNGMADFVVDAIDAGGAGSLEFQTSGDVEVATLPFGATAFGAASAGTATANAVTSDTSATGGTAAKFVVKSGAADTIFSGAVATSGSDINLSSLSIGSGDTVSLSSLTYSAPA